MQGDLIAELVELVGFQPQFVASPAVTVVGIGDDGVQPIVAAVQLNDDEHSLVGGRGGRTGRVGQQRGQHRRQRKKRGGLQEPASR